MIDDILKFSTQFLESLPHAQKLKMSIVDAKAGAVDIAMPYDTAFIGDMNTGVVHGGAISALLDTAAGTAVVTHPQSGIGTVTLNLRIDHIRPATPGQTIIAKACCLHVTESVAFVQVRAYDDDLTTPVSTANAAFTVPTVRISL